MPAAVTTYVAASVAVLGAGVIMPLSKDHSRVEEVAVSLAAAVEAAQPCSGYLTEGCDIWATPSYTPVALNQNGSAANIPTNLLNAVISIPRAFIDAINDLSYALEVTGNWWVYTPTNVLGFDPADPPKATALANLVIPFKPLSNVVGDHFAWWARANLPMNAGCTGSVGPACADPNAILGDMFLAPIWNLAAGYQFPELFNPVSDDEAHVGEEIPGSVGTQVPWSRGSVRLDLFDPLRSVTNYLLADPESNRPKPITLDEVAATVERLGKALILAFNPFVPRSFLLKGWPYTILTPLFLPFVPTFCPTCDPQNPGGPPVGEQIPQRSAASTAILAGDAVTESGVGFNAPAVVPVASQTAADPADAAGVGAAGAVGSDQRGAPAAAQVKAESADADADTALDAEIAALADADVDAAGPAGTNEKAGADAARTDVAPTRAVGQRRGLAPADDDSRDTTAPADSGADGGEQAGE